MLINSIAKLNFNVSDISKIYLSIGVSFAMSYHNKYKETETIYNKIYRTDNIVTVTEKELPGDINNFNYGLVGGVGLRYSDVIIEIKGLYGLSDLNLFDDIETYNRVFSMSFGYVFVYK